MQILHYFCIMGSDCRFSAKSAIILQFYSTSGFVGGRPDYTESRYPGTMVLGMFLEGRVLKNPKWTDFVFWGVFKGVFVSRIMELKGLGYFFASDCIPKLLFQRFGVFLRGRMYPKWSVLHDLGCMGLRISQTSCFLNLRYFSGRHISQMVRKAPGPDSFRALGRREAEHRMRIGISASA